MSATIVARSETSFTVHVEIPYGSSMLDFEQAIQDRLNQAGVVATQEALQRFDTDGSPIVIGSVKFTSKGQLPKEYQTPYGVATVARHVYQSPQGGKTYCPLDRDARIVTSSTPRFAKMIAHKYAEFGSGRVLIDLEENHGRKVARSFVQNVADAVATVALAKEESWDYALPEMEHPVATITLGLDGTCLLMCEDAWREAMVGTIGFYDKAGERQHTIYMAATPEYGKATFLGRMDREVERV
ncbi:MAG TPA: ISKra4 family transposase, partial [Isosphaeraceae bacterium]|nr:ISKra4 family transposase [Isosphaeraceae bacterium]